ncbi:alpha/beta hydrolase [Trichothermofontia sichuanensis B231]|uniref:alpha/beta hydrolase n=1 Tax=Trichothermofontia sichuanensis TaxID=3045816 RepID=UPI0022454B22|nr:alpha/beta hydrolase [Trichothermofontia sichuanensis]UZQ55280.1 alpha/beta hydrolase [Trichothermofontia sichuanensis B231]
MFLQDCLGVKRWFTPSRWLGSLLAVGILEIGATVLMASSSATAAERVVFTYGPIRQAVTIQELETLAETGQATGGLRFLLRVAGVAPESAQQVLTHEVGASLLFLDRALNSVPGEYLLFQMGYIFHTPARVDNIQALRSALVLSAVDNNSVSLLRFFQNYPTQDLMVDGVQLARTAREISSFVARVGEKAEVPLAAVRNFLDGIICECESASP